MAERRPAGKNLPAAAAAGWQAYLDMCAAKAAHFAYLEFLNASGAAGSARSLAESAHLAGLLDLHDRAVKRFATVSAALRASDGEAHAALVAALREDAEALLQRAGPGH